MIKKNGWGLSGEIVFLVLFFICMVMAFFWARKIGLFHGSLEESDLKHNYSFLETSLLKASKNYVNDVYNNDTKDNILIIRVSQLVNNSYLNTFKDDNGNACSGYALVYKNSSSDMIYEPYVKCKNYTTSGYDTNKE